MDRVRHSITTKFGDHGKTRLFSGEEVDKSSPRPDTYGEIDELVCILGIARTYCLRLSLKEAILEIQRLLFTIGSEIATAADRLDRLPKKIDKNDIEELEKKMTELENEITLPQGFIVPGNSVVSSHLHHARAVARRCERRIVGLYWEKVIINQNILIWFNRLSDYLYLLAVNEDAEPLLVKARSGQV